MYPITNEVMALFEAEQRKVLRITGTDKNGAVISITGNDVIADSFQVDRYSCNGEKLEVGTAIAAQMSLTLENGGGQYNGIVFEGAELFVEVGIADWTQSSPTITYVPCGYFTPDEQPRRLSTISITGLDRMTKFDVVVDAADLTFPATIAGLVGQVCTLCGVTLAQSISGLVNAGVNVAELPTAQEEITYRNLIQWCAGVMGTNAWFDWNGQLRFSWYENATGYVSTVDNRYSSDLYEDDLTVSGVEYTNDSGIVIVEGTDDYAIDLTGNVIAGPLVATVLPALNTALNGFTYRPFTAATVNAPYLWPMDIVTFTDKDGNNHTSVLTNVAFGLNGTTAMESKGMTYAINKLAQPKGFTREQAQLVSQAMEHVEQDIDESLTQQEIFNRLTDDGAAQGLLLYNGQLYINASYINAGYLSADHIQGGKLTLGGQGNQNGVLQVLDAAGQEIGTWTKDGIQISAGRIQLSQEALTSSVEVLLQQSITEPFKVIYNDNTGEFITKLVGEYFSIGNTDSGHSIRLSPEDLFLFDGSNVWFYLNFNNGSPNMSIYGSAFIEGDTRIKGNLTLDNALGIDSGGTGALTAADARTNLGVTPANIGAKAVQSAVRDPTASGTAVAFIDSISQNAQGVISPTKKTVQSASQSAAGLMSAADKKKLDGIAAGAQVNSVTGVKGNAESSYRTGNVSITPANIGAVAKTGDTMTGPLKWASGTALPAASSLQYFLGIDAFADGGTTHYITAANLLAAIGAVAKSGDTMTGTLTTTAGTGINVAPSGARAYIYLSPQGDYASDVRFQCAGSAKWSLSSRDSSADYFFGLYNHTTGLWTALFFKDDTIQFAKPLPVGSGGTGATTAAGARTNLGTSLYISSNTSATVYNQLNALNTNETINAMLTSTAADYLSGGKVTTAVTGQIRKASSNTYVFNMFNTSGNAYTWVSNVTASGVSLNSCYQYTGTKIK